MKRKIMGRVRLDTYIPDEEDDDTGNHFPPKVSVALESDCNWAVVHLGVPAGQVPHLAIERRRNGWMIVLHPDPDGDSILLYVYDDTEKQTIAVENGCRLTIEEQPPKDIDRDETKHAFLREAGHEEGDDDADA